MNGTPRRFYKEARVVETDGAYGVALDGRTLRTPAGKAFVVPTHALAEACADEWRAQGANIKPQTMPLTRLANVAIDRAPDARDEMATAIAKHGETDLVCHRAEAPAALVARQKAVWDPLVRWAGEALRFFPEIVVGVRAGDSDPTRLREEARALDDFRLTALAHATGLSGSAIIGFVLLRGLLDGARAFEAAALDDIFQLETWGEDAEARARLEALRAEFKAAARFLAALR